MRDKRAHRTCRLENLLHFYRRVVFVLARHGIDRQVLEGLRNVARAWTLHMVVSAPTVCDFSLIGDLLFLVSPGILF